MDNLKITILTAIIYISSCSSNKKTGMEFIYLDNGHTKVIDYDKRVTSYIDHSGRVYDKVYWKNQNGAD